MNTIKIKTIKFLLNFFINFKNNIDDLNLITQYNLNVDYVANKSISTFHLVGVIKMNTIKIKTNKFFNLHASLSGLHRFLRMPTSILCIGAVLLFGTLLVGCSKDKRNNRVDNRVIDRMCDINNPTLDCDGDGTRNGIDDFVDNACASLDTDGDGFPDAVEAPREGAPCDEEEAGELVTTLIGTEDSDDVIPDCSVDAFKMCEDPDDDGDGIPDDMDEYPTDPIRSCTVTPENIGNSSLDCDNDNFNNSADNCPSVTNRLQTDSEEPDGDGVGDACDVDDNNNGLIEINYLEDLDYVRYDLNGRSYKPGADANASTAGAPNSSTDLCSMETAAGSGIYLCGYELASDLDFNDNASYSNPSANKERWTVGMGWMPIGDPTNNFNAIFDGNGSTITNLMIRRSADILGLFGYISEEGMVQRLNLASAFVDYTGSGGARIGILAGQSDGTIVATSADGTVDSGGGADRVGGLVGRNEGTITASYAMGDVNSGAGAGDYAGGLVGFGLASGIITASYAMSNVSGGDGNEDFVGGLIGRNDNGDITASYAVGTVLGGDGDEDNVGGLAGRNTGSNAMIRASYAMSNVSGGDGNEDLVGGLIGRNRNGDIAASYAVGTVRGGGGNGDDVGGLVGRNIGSRAIITASYAMVIVNGGDGDGDKVGGLVGSNSGVITASYATGDADGGNGSGGIGLADVVGGLVGDSSGSGAIITASYGFGGCNKCRIIRHKPF